MGNFGVLTLIPPVIVIVLAIWSKKPVESLLIGCVSAYIIIAVNTSANFIEITYDSFFNVITDYDNVYIIVVCALFGSLIALLNASNGTDAIAIFVGKVCRGTKSILLSSWLLGIVIFIDDYMNIMTISSCMKKLCDNRKIPRATLAYIIDSTGAPACVLVPFSTWAVFYASNFYEQKAVQDLGYGSAMGSYIHSIPYMFYASISLIVVLLFALQLIPVIGPLKKEYTVEALSAIEESADLDVKYNNGKLIDFLIPIGLMIVVTIISDMFVALIIAIIACFVLYVPRKVISASDFCELWIKGIADLMPTLVILIFAFFMKQACADINLPTYVVDKCLPYVTGSTFPVIAFVLVSILAFITGDSWGVPAICVPIIIPLAAACNANILLTMGAIVSGGVFCSHACFYSDATVLTSTCCDIDCMTHAKTQLPYALISFIICALGFMIVGIVI